MRICPQCRTRTEARECPTDGTATLDEAAFGKQISLKGKVFDGRYAVQDPIGQGGMGTVYRAKQLSVGRSVALKVLDESLARDIEMAARFVREAQLASRLQHPNTIVIHDFGHTREGLFIAMELLEGQTLRARLSAGGPLPLDEALSIARQVADSLGHAHRSRVIHRDLKPENIFLHNLGETSVVKVLDFGIAKVFEDQGPTSDEVFKTQVGSDGEAKIFGTFHYMAPEQIEGKDLDGRADVYALGVILYEMVAGQRPFPGETMMAVLRMHLQEPPLPLPDAVPDEVAYLVHQLLAKDPAQRPDGGSAVVKEIDRVKSVLAGVAVPSKTSRRRMTRPSMSAARGRSDSNDALKAWTDHAVRQSRLAWVRHGATLRNALIVLLIIAGVGAGAYALRHRDTTPDDPPVQPAVSDMSADSVVDPVLPDVVTAPPVEKPEPDSPSVPPESDRRAWIRIEAGEFQMGRAPSEDGWVAGEGPVHSVTITRPFVVRATEITQREWVALMGNNPSGHRDCERCPVENVNWYEALAYCNALSKHHGREPCYELRKCTGTAGVGMRCEDAQLTPGPCRGYRLPTEAEWEYAATRGTTDGALSEAAWYAANADGISHEVGKREPDSLGLRDTLGNVAEWVWDVYSERYYEWGPPTDPPGPAMGPERSLRGCHFGSPENRCSPGARRGREPIVLDSALGFRPIRRL